MLFGLTFALGFLAAAESTNTDVYNFPMLGTVQYLASGDKQYYVYGSVTIVNQKFVLAAAENLVQLEPLDVPRRDFIFNDRHRFRLWVFAGSDLMQPPVKFDDDKVQKRKVKEIHFGRSSEFVEEITHDYGGQGSATLWNKLATSYSHTVDTHLEVNPSEQDKFPPEFKWNPFRELQWDVAVILLYDDFTWSPYVLPIPLHWKNEFLTRIYSYFWSVIQKVELNPYFYEPCAVPGWNPIGNNEMIYHRVVYVRFKECAAAICGAYPSSCLRYLNVRQHICFKALGFSDSCVFDQGAPVMCPWYQSLNLKDILPTASNQTTLGILVKTFDCGTQGLPLVFTRTYAIAAFLRLRLDDRQDNFNNDADLQDPKYTEKPDVER